MALTGSASRDVDVFEKAASEAGLSPETKDMFRREFSAEELLLMSRYLKESKKEYSRKKFLVRVALVLFAAFVTFLLVAFAWDPNTRTFRISPWSIVFMPLILALIILPISYILGKRKTTESNAPLVGERKLRHYALIAIENEEVRKANNIVKTLKRFQD